MSSNSDSIIWSANQCIDQVESNLSLGNPLSNISQREESTASQDSQLANSSVVDVISYKTALDEERRWLKYRVENLNREECIITAVLAQMILSGEELPGVRDCVPTEYESKQSLLYMSYGEGWQINSLRIVLDLAEFLPVGLRRLSNLGVRERNITSRKLLENRLEQCLDLTRRLNLNQIP